MPEFKQSSLDKAQVEFFKRHIPAMMSIPDIETRWYKYKLRRGIDTKDDVLESQTEMKVIVKILTDYVKELFESFEFKKAPERQAFKTEIIMYWHQSSKYEDLPPATKLAWNSFKENQNRSISLLSYEDVKKLVNIDKTIERLFEVGNIGHAVYSDYLRMLLLEKYDVMWVDATIFNVGHIPEEYFTQPFWSIKGKYLNDFAFKVRGLTYDCSFGQVYLLGGSDNYVYSKVRQMLEHYYSMHDFNFTYFMTYVFFEYLYLYDPIFTSQVNRLETNNEKVEYITCQRDKDFSINLYNNMLDRNTVFYKLSNRLDYDYDDKTKLLAGFIDKQNISID